MGTINEMDESGEVHPTAQMISSITQGYDIKKSHEDLAIFDQTKSDVHDKQNYLQGKMNLEEEETSQENTKVEGLSTLERIQLAINSSNSEKIKQSGFEANFIDPDSHDNLNAIINHYIMKTLFQIESDPLNLLVSCSKCCKNLNDSFWFICLKCDCTIYCVHCQEEVEPKHDEEHIFLKVNGKENKTERPSLETKQGETQVGVRYSAKFKSLKGINRTVIPSKPFSVDLTVENDGRPEWPQETELCCVEGFYKNSIHEGIPSLKYKGDHSFTLRLTAPSNPAVYKTRWRLGYRNNNDIKQFGEYLPMEITVENPKENKSINFNDFSLNNSGDPNRKSNTNTSKRK